MKSFLPNKLYDILKWVALVALDAIGVCYKALADIWHLPYGNEVLLTASAIAVLLGTLIGVASAQYNSK